MESLYCL